MSVHARVGWMVPLVALVACESAGGPAASCGSAAFTIFSPCGFQSATTTCSPDPPTCWSEGPEGFCSLGEVTASCVVVVVLGDGTTHTISVAVAPSADPACDAGEVTTPAPDFTSATCGG